MKSLISEIVKIQLVRELLSEGRVEDAKAKFPQDADVIDYFVSQDPSGNNKYLNWEMKMYKQLPPEAPVELKERHKELIANLIKGFHQHAPRRKMRDINQYKTLGDLNTAVSPLIKASEEKAAAKLQQEEGSHKLYEDKDWLMLIPLTHEASCKYGANTQWCVASRDTSEHFKSYTRNGLLVYLIHKKSNNKFAFYHDMEEGDGVEIYNPIDNDISWDYGIDGSVKNFLEGLVEGELETYLQGGDGYDDDEEFEIRFNDRGITRTIWAYDEEDLGSTLINTALRHFLGRGSGRNSLQKYKDVLRVFDLNLEIQGKTQASPFTIKDSNGDPISGFNNQIFNVYARNGGINDVLDEYLHDRFDEEGMDFISWLLEKTNQWLNFQIIGPGFSEEKRGESKEVDPNNIMSKDQYKSILKVYEDYLKVAEEEIRKRQQEAIDKVLGSISFPNYERFEKCLSIDSIYDNLESLPNTKRTLIQVLRNRGVIRGRLPRVWPKAGERPVLNVADARYVGNYCMREMNDNGHLAGLTVQQTVNMKGKEKQIPRTFNWLYSELNNAGLRVDNGYEGLIMLLMNREKAKKQKNP